MGITSLLLSVSVAAVRFHLCNYFIDKLSRWEIFLKCREDMHNRIIHTLVQAIKCYEFYLNVGFQIEYLSQHLIPAVCARPWTAISW